MAYLRKDIKNYGTYISVVEAYRDDRGKAQQRVIANLGNMNNYSSASLRNIARNLYELAGGDRSDLKEPQLEELERYNYGFYQIYNKLLTNYALDKLFDRLSRKHKLSYSFKEVLLLMLMERLNEPASKRRNYFNQEEYLGLDNVVKLEQLYRSLDLLDKYSDLIQHQIYQKGRDLFNMELDVVFYDVTTLYFESQKEIADSLRQKGFGKDGKIGETQIVLSLLIDKNQQPVGYEIYEGSQYEGHTMADALNRLKQKYEIGQIIVVADRGMLNRENLDSITDHGYEFIIGERLKNLPKAMVDHLTNLSNYQSIGHSNTEQADPFKYTQLEYGDRTIIGTYSVKRAKKDKGDRERKIAKALQLIKTPSKLKAKAARFFLKSKGSKSYEIDQDKINRAEKFDGFLAICTTATNLHPTDVLNQYKQLFKIEKSFRTIKHHLAIRPIFHWTNSRIKGHVCMSFIAYTLLNQLILTLADKKIQATEEQLRTAIGKMQVSLVKVNDGKLFMRSKLQPMAIEIAKSLKIKQLPNYLHPEAINSYL